METRYCYKKEIYECFTKNMLKHDLKSKSTIGISSVADLVEIIEEDKKSNFCKGMNYCDKSIEYQNQGILYFAELDHNKLIETLFDDYLWANLSSRKVNPLTYVRNLTLKKISDSVWWSEEVYEQMRTFYP